MAYSELIKNFERIRDYMRSFFVYGFRSREEYDARSARSYDNERRRVESWLGEYMGFRQDAQGKQVFLSVDSRAIPENPLYEAFRAKSFTDGDIRFHFYVLDMLAPGEELTLREILSRSDEYGRAFARARELDESTLRKKLREYEELGLVERVGRGRELRYRRAEDGVALERWRDALDFFTETDPLGVIGSYLRRRLPPRPSPFRFKHRYLLYALDSEVLCALAQALGESRRATVCLKTGRKEPVFPHSVYRSAQNGRQYLYAWGYVRNEPLFVRLDNIRAVAPGEIEAEAQALRERCEASRQKLWGVSLGRRKSERVEMILRLEPGEDYVAQRLLRERRCGRVEPLGEGRWRFEAEVSDPTEMLPWLRSFIGRIEKLSCTDERVTRRFWRDMEALWARYGGGDDAV